MLNISQQEQDDVRQIRAGIIKDMSIGFMAPDLVIVTEKDVAEQLKTWSGLTDIVGRIPQHKRRKSRSVGRISCFPGLSIWRRDKITDSNDAGYGRDEEVV